MNFIKLRERLKRYEADESSPRYSQTLFELGMMLKVFEDWEVRVFEAEGYVFKHSRARIYRAISKGEN